MKENGVFSPKQCPTNFWESGGYKSYIVQGFINNNVLSPQEAQMIHLRYEKGLSATQVAKELFVNRTTVRRLSATGLRKLPAEVVQQLRNNSRDY